jgi:hypothetical protein
VAGLGFLKRLRREPALRNTVVIVLAEDGACEGLDANVAGRIDKGGPDVLVAELKEALAELRPAMGA